MAVALTAAVTGCKKNDSGTPAGESGSPSKGQSEGTDTLSGTIKMSGSTSMEKMVNALMEDFMNRNNGVTVTCEFAGSSAGVEAVTNGTVDIGNTSRELKESEIQNGATANVVAIDGIAVIVDSSNSVSDLTKEQLAGIYTGTIGATKRARESTRRPPKGQKRIYCRSCGSGHYSNAQHAAGSQNFQRNCVFSKWGNY